MGNLIQLEYNGNKIFIESADVGYEQGLAPAGAIETVEKNLEKMLDIIKPFCQALKNCVDSLGNNKPDSYSSEFGLSVSGEGNAFIAKVSAEASVKVVMSWEKS